MIIPNKITRLDRSIIGKAGYLILEGIDEIPLQKLMKERLRKFSDIGEFILALDTLYVLGKIELDEDEGMVKYVS